MSGIVGVHGTASDEEFVAKSLKRIKHRGPDGERFLPGPGYVLGCCKSKAEQPFSGSHPEHANTAVVFDGEILSEEADKSDAEMLWHLYSLHQEDLFEHLDGQFAMAIANEEELVLARDYVGSRPLFYGSSDGAVFFASEVKALVGHVDEVKELPAGKVYSTRTGIRDFQMYLPAVPGFQSAEEAKGILRSLLQQATIDRMRDGAVGGVGFSGGLDSSIIAALAFEVNPGLHLFTVGVDDGPDLAMARLLAERLGATDRHHVFVIAKEEVESAVRDAVWHLESFEEDCISGCIANLFASRLASEHTNCCLSGEGSDELFGGYHLLKDIENPEDRRAMMDKLVAIAYNTALRRLDRGWLANSVLYRTPFLDSRIIAFAKTIPVQWKIHGPVQTEKWILREAFRDLLPPEIVDRRKLRFSAGTGIDGLMDRIASSYVTQEEYEANSNTLMGYKLNSPKELWYYRIFRELFPESAESQVARWDPFKW